MNKNESGYVQTATRYRVKKENRNRLIVEFRNADPKPTYEKLAETFNISRERVRQIVMRSWRQQRA